MARPDLYDYIGLGLAGFVALLWVAHIVLPPLPPDTSRLGPAAGAPQALPFPGR